MTAAGKVRQITVLAIALAQTLGTASCHQAATLGGGEPITIGLIAPESQALGVVGVSFQRIATVAVAEINAKGGVNGHPLVLITLDDGTDANAAPTRVEKLVELGAVAIVGPATSGAVTMAFPKAKELEIPIISPSSTAPNLATADDGGYMFRNVPSDSIQGIAMAYYLTQKAVPPVTTVVLVNEDTPYGNGLADSFRNSFVSSGGTVSGQVKYTQNLVGNAAADEVVADIVAQAPSMVVLIALEQDGLKIVNRWDASGMVPNTKWFFTDGARSAGFLAGLPTKLIGSLGTAPTVPATGPAYDVLEDRYRGVFPEPEFNLANEVFAANVWDAVFLIAAGLAQEERDFPGQAHGGAHLRDSITKVSKGPGATQHAGQWRDLVTSIQASDDVDYDGASGPCDFDANGETVGPYEVWKIIDTGGGVLAFQQELFLEASEIQALAGP